MTPKQRQYKVHVEVEFETNGDPIDVIHRTMMRILRRAAGRAAVEWPCAVDYHVLSETLEEK